MVENSPPGVLPGSDIGGYTGRLLRTMLNNQKTLLWRIVQIEKALALILDACFEHKTTGGGTLPAETLRNDLRALSVHQKETQQTAFWQEICTALRRCAETGDPRDFLQWPPIVEAMQTSTTPTVIAAFLMLRRSPEWRAIWRPILRHPRYGHPPPFLPYPASNPITVQHAGHLYYFHKTLGEHFFDADCVVEFGAGYGSMCRIARRLGFESSYFIFDLPPMLCVQRYFLSLNGINSCYDEGDERVKLFSDVLKLRRHLKCYGRQRIAIISTWALSEMPSGLRNDIEPILGFEGYNKALFAYQAEFAGINNRSYFSMIMQQHSRWEWRQSEIPYQPNNYYLFGSQKA
jgi:hypothetical protein